MKYEYTGLVYEVQPTQTVGAANFRKRDLIIKDENQQTGFVQFIPFTFKQGNCEKLDKISGGMRVKIEFFVDGCKAPYNGRFFPCITGTSVTVLGAAGAAGGGTPPAAAAAKTFADVVEVWNKEHPGEDKAALKAFCEKVCPDIASAAKTVGMKFTDLAASKPGTFEKIIAAIRPPKVEDGAASPSQDPDDIPW